MKLKVMIYGAAIAGVGFYVYTVAVGPDPISFAQSQVTAELIDPNSAQFREVNDFGNHVCGEVNARNSFGGYTGFQPFYVKGDEVLIGQAAIDPRSSLQNLKVRTRCLEHLTQEVSGNPTAAPTN